MRPAMKIRSPKDFWSGLIFIAIGAAFIALASQYRMGDLHRMGPGLFPTIVGGLLTALGALIVGGSLVFEGPRVAGFAARPLAFGLLSIVLFALALQYLGLVIAVGVLVLVGAYASPDVRPLQSIALAGVMVAFSVGVFVWLLGLPLPLWPQW
jgi:putative tricarboxylic transport membrane protein